MKINIEPDLETFSQLYNKNKPQLVWHRMIADLETPITASLKLKEVNQPFFLLESVEGGERRGRYSIIGLDPDLIWRCSMQQAEISHQGGPFIADGKDVMASFRKLHAQSKLPIPTHLPPMASGLIGYMSYDAIRLIESSIPDQNEDPIGIPLALFMRPTIMIVFDSVTTSVYILASVRNKNCDTQTATDAFNQVSGKITKIVDKLCKTSVSQYQVKSNVEPFAIDFMPNISKSVFCNNVTKAKEYIFAGDIFQVVPSQRFQAPFKASPFAFYRSLRHINPSPYLFYLDFCEFQLIGSSPEILVRLRDNKVTIRPLAGTRKRGRDSAEDAALAADLLADTKEVAEHLMLVDLSRNDVSKVTKPGSVKVTEEMKIEFYSHVMHICSNVEGDIDPQYDALDALFAGLPVGTVSGAPKIRAMQIIDELEQQKRSFYAGCVGYFSANGTMDTCITLRTALIKENIIYCQAGSGIVADSDPEAEYQESCNKAKALMKAAAETSKFC